jgi:FAD/FMN-containing dehydrogenase
MVIAVRDIEVLKAGFGGTVLLPGEPDYDDVRKVWNGNIDRRPAAIMRCTTPEDVAAAIAFGRARGLEISVRGGGHNYSGNAVVDDGLMIDLGLMRQVNVDADAKRATAGGGATWADLDGATQAHGLATVGGFVSHTGIGGLTLGGGMGWLSKKLGLTVDNLISAHVVTADGAILRASADENPDLFWALRGGGGNFGVVTEFEYQLHEVGPLVNLGLFFFDVEHGRDALRFMRDFIKTVPDGYGVTIVGLSAPPAPFVPEEHHFKPGFALGVLGLGTFEEHAAAIAGVMTSAPPRLFELVTPMPYAQLQQMFDEAAAPGFHGYEKALYLDELTDEVIDLWVDFLPRKHSPLTITPVFDLSGAFLQANEDETAFGGTRTAGFAFNISGVSPVPELFEPERAWVREFWDALLPYARGAGSYVNFMAEYEEDRVRAAYGAAKYERLSQIKARYDPDNVFHLNVNIKPTP